MPVVNPEQLVELQRSPDGIRNVGRGAGQNHIAANKTARIAY